MRTFAIELEKEKRTGIILLMLMAGILGAAYALVVFSVRRDALSTLPMAPMDVLLTQVYGMIMILNLFGIIVAACMIYNMEFTGNAIRKMYLLPVHVPLMYFCKFLILTVLLLIATGFQNLALAKIGVTELPRGTFSLQMLLSFAGYSFLTSMPVLSFMLFVSSRSPSMWIPLGIGVAGFLSGMALASANHIWLLAHPFVVMLKPAVAMCAEPELVVVIFSLAHTFFFLFAGLWAAQKRRCLG